MAVGPFKIMLSALERRTGPDVLGDPTRDRVQAEIARLFDVDIETASNIVTAIPIVVLDGLTAAVAGVVRERLRNLAALGCQVTTTDAPTESMGIPRVNWPQVPPIAHVAEEELSRALGVERSGGGAAAPPRAEARSGLACPGCGLELTLSPASGAPAHALPRGAAPATTPRGTPSPATSPRGSAAPATSPRGAAAPATSPRGAVSSAAAPPLATTPPPAPAPAPRPAPPPPSAEDDWLAPAPGSRPATRRGTGRFDDPALLSNRSPRPAPAPVPVPAPPPPPPPPSPPPVGLDDLRIDISDEVDAGPISPSARPSSKRERLREVMGGGLDESSGTYPSLDLIEDSRSRAAAPAPAPANGGRDMLASSASLPGLGVPGARDALASSASLPGLGLDDPLVGGRGSNPLDDSLGLTPPPRTGRAGDEYDSLDDLLTDGSSDAGRGRASTPRPVAAPRSGEPALDDVLRLFGPEDDQPLDDGFGLDPAPLDLGRAPAAAPAPARSKGGPSRTAPAPAQFDEEISDILEPLDPSEAKRIIKVRGQPQEERQGSTASHLRVNQPPDLEPLNPSEAFAILAADQRSKDRRTSHTRGVPLAASDEDVALAGDNGRGTRKKTDPFARARRQMEDGRAPTERKSSRKEKAPTSARGESRPQRRESERREPERSERREPERSERSKRSERRRPAGPPPANSPGSHGLVLNHLQDPDQREKAAGLIAEIKGCGLEEARRLCDRMIVPVLKDVSRELADYHLERFRALDITGRVTSRPPRS